MGHPPAVFGSLAMGLYANRPIAVAPYMGENAFIAFGLTALPFRTDAGRFADGRPVVL